MVFDEVTTPWASSTAAGAAWVAAGPLLPPQAATDRSPATGHSVANDRWMDFGCIVQFPLQKQMSVHKSPSSFLLWANITMKQFVATRKISHYEISMEKCKPAKPVKNSMEKMPDLFPLVTLLQRSYRLRIIKNSPWLTKFINLTSLMFLLE
ncbi:hypothetical protein [Duganella caerulea]|uniref:hypothetical protein n=1 Tax=Duganella caerulea TaxID=2885762 RepID=UPI0040376CC6